MSPPGPPTPEHRQLARFAGTWRVRETLHPSPWDPRGGTAEATLVARLILDGLALEEDYEQRREGRVTYRGHGVLAWDPREARYLLWWFDTLGQPPRAPARGSFEGDRLVLEQESPVGRARYTYDFVRDGEFAFRIEHSRDGKDWRAFVEARYVRE
jgi:hypothetical protein